MLSKSEYQTLIIEYNFHVNRIHAIKLTRISSVQSLSRVQLFVTP